MIKEIKNEEKIEQKGNKFLYIQERIVEMDFDDVLAVATKSKVKVEEIKNSIEGMKAESRRAQNFLQKNAKSIGAAKIEAEKQFCEKCGMNFKEKANKKMKSSKTTKVYKVLCKNCAKTEND